MFDVSQLHVNTTNTFQKNVFIDITGLLTGSLQSLNKNTIFRICQARCSQAEKWEFVHDPKDVLMGHIVQHFSNIPTFFTREEEQLPLSHIRKKWIEKLKRRPEDL